jgi:hypothetical protein
MSHLRRLGQVLWEAQWLLLGVLGMLAVTLGFVGFQRHFDALGQTPSVWDVLYRDLQLFVLEWGSEPRPVTWELQVARFLAPAVTVLAAVRTVLAIFREEIEMLELRRMAGHVVVCGLGQKGSLLVRSLRERGRRVVVVERDPHNEFLEVCRNSGALVLLGDARDRELLRGARVQRATHLISVCGADGVNAEVAVQARELCKEREGPALNCLVHIFDPQLCILLRMEELAAPRRESFMLDFFNVFESGARGLLEQYPAFDETILQRAPQPQIVVVGLARLGERLLVQVARGWKVCHTVNGSRFRATVVDEQAEAKVESLCLRYPWLTSICELVARQMPIDSLEFEQSEFLVDRQRNCDVSEVYVCLDDDALGLSAALALNQRLKGRSVPIVVAMARGAGLASLVSGTEGTGTGFENLHAFGLLDHTLNADLLLGGIYEVLARAIHEEYVRNQREEGQTPEANPAMVPWDDLPETLKESNREQAGHIGVKLRTVGCGLAPLTDWDAESFQFTQEEVELLAQMEHERWVAERRREGWTYSPGPKNMVRRTSPYMVTWRDLRDDVKEWDRVFIRGLAAFLAKDAFQIIRLEQRQEGEVERAD